PKCDPWPLHEKLEKEKEVIGIYLSGHPLDSYKIEMNYFDIVPLSELDQVQGKQIRIAGFVSETRHALTQKGDKWGKIVLNDYSGKLEIPFWRNDYVQFHQYLEDGQKLMITGTYGENRFRPGTMEFRVQDIMLLSDVKGKLTKKFVIHLFDDLLDEKFIQELKLNFLENSGSTDYQIIIEDRKTNEKTTLRNAGGAGIYINDQLVDLLNLNNAKYKIHT